MEWDEVRRLFPATERFVYLNAAEASPLPISAANDAKAFYERMLTEGDLPWDEWLEKRERTRKKTAELISATKAEIAFTQNTSQGMNLVASILKEDFGGCEVVTMDDEFPSSTLPWLNLGYELRFVKAKNAVYSIDEIKKNITPKTKILVTSHVQYKTGFKHDLVELGKLCEEKGLVFVVNATQSAGAMQIDVEKSNIDFLVFSGLKWPMAGYGIGVLFVDKKWLGKAYPIAGWQSVKDPFQMDNKKLDLKEEASAFEIGCPHFPNIFALGGSLDLLDKIGKRRVERRIYELGDYLVEKLEELEELKELRELGGSEGTVKLEIVSPLEKKHRSGITVIKWKNAEEAVQKLYKENVIVSARGEGLRVSVHVYNNEEDVDKFVKELQRLVK
ncbi:MAG: aminotransferase class V-fold PLP-dependent enzyme [Archaeoglobus sp.]|nr:aminotransferase class V-fold PLP-dependent enzyme [Archaeoglobus sp.]